MKKLLIISTIGITAALLVASLYHPDSPLLWVASDAVQYAYLRILLIVLLLAVLFTHPPRTIYVRSLMLIIGAILTIGVVRMVLAYEVNFLDAFVFIETGIILTIDAFEGEIYDGVSLMDRLVIKMRAKLGAGKKSLITHLAAVKRRHITTHS